jgi:hypothetical protein
MDGPRRSVLRDAAVRLPVRRSDEFQLVFGALRADDDEDVLSTPDPSAATGPASRPRRGSTCARRRLPTGRAIGRSLYSGGPRVST